ncbi:ABC transporter permease [Actinobaculum massiliense]|uniref:ABC transporter permease n=1 Tax=Actinobaculum massiliense TaxID=202789 RepID=UPI00288A7BC4|nr:ABC transporter permease [Actinobaculum massiliense]
MTSTAENTRHAGQSLGAWLAWRVLRGIGLFACATLALFALVQALPGDAATVSAGRHGEAAVEAAREAMGLDAPVLARYFDWLSGFVRGDLGTTLVTGVPVSQTLITPVISTLTVAAIVFAGLFLIALPVSIYAGARPSRFTRVSHGLATIVTAMPEFVVGILAVFVLAQVLGWLPVLSVPGPGRTVWQAPTALIMPSLCLWILCAASLFRRVRALVSTYANTAYVKDAYLSGLPPRTVLFHHLLPTASYPICQLFVQMIPYLLGGTVVIETITSFPGVGYSLIGAINNRDVPVVMGIGGALIAVTTIAYILADFIGKRFERIAAVI